MKILYTDVAGEHLLVMDATHRVEAFVRIAELRERDLDNLNFISASSFEEALRRAEEFRKTDLCVLPVNERLVRALVKNR